MYFTCIESQISSCTTTLERWGGAPQEYGRNIVLMLKHPMKVFLEDLFLKILFLILACCLRKIEFLFFLDTLRVSCSPGFDHKHCNFPQEMILQPILYSDKCALYNIEYTIYSVKCTILGLIRSAHCTVQSLQCTVYTVQCRMCIVYCTLYSLQYIVHYTWSIVECKVQSVHCRVQFVQCTVYMRVLPPYPVESSKSF